MNVEFSPHWPGGGTPEDARGRLISNVCTAAQFPEHGSTAMGPAWERKKKKDEWLTYCKTDIEFSATKATKRQV